MASKKRGRKTKTKRGRRKTIRSSTALRAGTIVTRKLSTVSLKKWGLKLKAIGKRGGKKAYKLVRAKALKKTKTSRTRKPRSGSMESRGWVKTRGGGYTIPPHPATVGMSDRQRGALHRVVYRDTRGVVREMDTTGASIAIHGYKVGREWGEPGLKMGTILSIRPLTESESNAAFAAMAKWD